MRIGVMLGALSLAIHSAAAGAHAEPTNGLSVSLSDADAAAVQRALDRGAIIYSYDQAAWHGTDDMLVKLPDAAEVVGGWIVDGPANTPEIIFYDRNADDPKALYVANFRDHKLVSSRVLDDGDDRTLSAGRKAMIAAKRAAVASLQKKPLFACSDRPFNTVVLPPSSPGVPTLVYFLTPQTEADAIPLGGHHLFEVLGGEVTATRSFTKSCVTPKPDPKEPSPVSLFITHLLDPVPTEIHVFSSLAAKKPVYVSTPDARIWAVEGYQIRPVQESGKN